MLLLDDDLVRRLRLLLLLLLLLRLVLPLAALGGASASAASAAAAATLGLARHGNVVLVVGHHGHRRKGVYLAVDRHEARHGHAGRLTVAQYLLLVGVHDPRLRSPAPPALRPRLVVHLRRRGRCVLVKPLLQLTSKLRPPEKKETAGKLTTLADDMG